MDPGTVSASALSSIFIATLRISQVIYELKAVGEQTRDLLDSTNHVETSLQAARTLRRQKSCHLDVTEKRWIDEVLTNTEKTLGNVATLIEPARVDLQTNFGRVGLVNRGLFVFRDSPKVGTNLSRLNLASQSLNTAMNILCTREGRALISPIEKNALHRNDIAHQTRNDVAPPPTYIESEFLNRRRHTHTSKRATTRCSSTTSLGTMEEKPDLQTAVVSVIEEEGGKEKKAAEMVDKFTLEDNVVAIPTVVAVQEVNPTPVEPPQQNLFDEANGLQLCETTHFQRPTSKIVDEAEGLQVCDAEYRTSAHILTFEGADGLEVCDGKFSSSPCTRQRQFPGSDGLQVYSISNSPIPVQQDSPVEVSLNRSWQYQQQTNQWHEQRASYHQLPYSIAEDARSSIRPWHSPGLQTHQWQHQHVENQHQRLSQPQNLPYPNPPYPNPPYHNVSNQNSLYQDPSYQSPPYPNPPYPNQRLEPQPAYQLSRHQKDQSQDRQWQYQPPSPCCPFSSPDPNWRSNSIATSAKSDRPTSQELRTTIAPPVSNPSDARQPTESPSSSISLSDMSRRASQASSTSTWTPSEVSQVPPMSTRRSRGRAWLEFQSER